MAARPKAVCNRRAPPLPVAPPDGALPLDRATPMPVSIAHPDRFVDRHIGPTAQETAHMLKALGLGSLEALVDAAVPKDIRVQAPLHLPPAVSEHEMLRELDEIANQNKLFRSFLGMGYHGTITPAVILRNILENPGWYTAYTPYQAEIAQGRLEALLNFQAMVMDLTGMDLANASLLDEATAAAEAMALCHLVKKRSEAGGTFVVSPDCHPQTLAVVRTRAEPLGITVRVEDPATAELTGVFGVLLQYPASDGGLHEHRALADRVRAADAMVVVAADILALCVLEPPARWGADVVVGSTQRFGVPMGYGGPHAAYFATRTAYARSMPGRIIGVSQDANGRPALRMALQTREQHIRREKATSNICTAQVLLAVMAGMYAVYHGPAGLTGIAQRVHGLAACLALGLARAGFKLRHAAFFDTVCVSLDSPTAASAVVDRARAMQMNFRLLDDKTLCVSLDEATRPQDVEDILHAFSGKPSAHKADALAEQADEAIPAALRRTGELLKDAVFHRYHNETDMQRYLRALEARDLSLTHSMIPLGSCTMKLNAAAEMLPITWARFCNLHPFVPADQAVGYKTLFKQLEAMLAEITGFAAVSLQPNAGSQGEYAGLMCIRGFHKARGQGHRNVCLIPQSAHGTNPASAVMAGLKVVVVRCDDDGNVDLEDLAAKADQHRDNLAALMVTYPSTHGVFESGIRKICSIIHDTGGQVYMDGANMNAQVGLCRPGDFGPDVCHLNLHKTFCIPHGGGGPGMGPICVAAHLAPHLPGHPVVAVGGDGGAVSAAPYGSSDIMLISWAYIRMMGVEGLTRATQLSILNANYVAHRLKEHYPVLYRGKEGLVAHECILDMRSLKHKCGIEVEDIAKRLMDYGFHAPTVSFPVPSTMMVEPTESEGLAELERFCEAMMAIREEIREVEAGTQPQEGNVLKNAPHPASVVTANEWTRPYPREKAAWPLPWVRQHKFWPSVARVNNALGDRNLVCGCAPMEAYLA